VTVYSQETLRREVERAEAFKALVETSACALDAIGAFEAAQWLRSEVTKLEEQYALAAVEGKG